jgi:hypothetical protein
MTRISKLDLVLVATHPDRAGGLGFLRDLPVAFAPLSFALSAVMASRWPHDAYFHGVPLAAFGLPIGIFALVTAAAFVLPLAPFTPRLIALRRRALLDYGALLSEHGRLVDRRGIRGETVQAHGLLSAPELGPVADTGSLYNAVDAARPAPIGPRMLLLVLAPILLSVVTLVSIEVPLKQAVLKIPSTLL